MKKLNEQEILQRLEMVSQIEPSAEAVGRAMRRVRSELYRRKFGDRGVVHTLLGMKWWRLAAAAVIALAFILYFVDKQNVERQNVTEKVVFVVPAGQGAWSTLNAALCSGGMEAFEQEVDRMAPVMNYEMVTPVTPVKDIAWDFEDDKI